MSFRFQPKTAEFSRNGLRNFAFQEKGSEMSSDCFSCSKSAHARGAAREPWRRGIESCLSLAGHLFLKQFSEAIFSPKIAIFDLHGLQSGTKIRSFGSYFSEQVRKLKSVFGSSRLARIAYEPIPWRAQVDPKIEEKKSQNSEPCFLVNKSKYFKKELQHGPQKGDFILRMAPLGPPLAPQCVS